ncbi:MAG: hypothetical protein HKO62_03395, partial [Gammaproteobacteria bacterium]|nr:hypothetical protein [Gammaproteobacteria bacterium]
MKFLSALGFVLSGLAAGFAGAAEIYDLEAGEITLDSSAPALITVNYSASNVGALAAPAPWWDSVYLTPDPSGATVSYRFPSTRIADDLAPGGSYARSVTSPGRLIPPGDYYIRTVIASGYYIFGEPPEPPENNLATFGPFTHSLPPGVEAV